MSRYVALALMSLLTSCGGSGSTQPPEMGEFTAILVVTNHNDAGPGSLRDAVDAAPAGAAVIFDVALPTGTIQLASAISISRDLAIGGLSGSFARHTVDGGNSVRHFICEPGVNVLIREIILTNGLGVSAGGSIRAHAASLSLIRVQFVANFSPSNQGGAVSSQAGFLYAEDCAFTANGADSGGAVYLAEGLGTLQRCSFYLNVADSGHGGAVRVENTEVMFVGCTFFDNEALIAGGAVAIRRNNDNTTQAEFFGCTLTQNSSASGGGIHVSHAAGLSARASVHATIVADNTASVLSESDIAVDGGSAAADGSNSIVGIGPVSELFNGPDGNQVGSGFPALDPELLPFAFDVLGRAFLSPAAGSPAINAFVGPTSIFLSDIDMLGQPRNVGAGFDVGAIEVQ